MSYLVDALKKAERERDARQSQDIHALSANAGSAAVAPRTGAWLWLVAILVASNVALAIYVWRPRPPDPASSTPPITTGPSSAGSDQSARLAPYFAVPRAPTVASAHQPASAPAQSEHNTAGTDAEPVTSTPSQSPASAGARPAPDRAEAAGHSSHHGQVTYSKAPLTDNNAGAAARGDASSGRDEPDAPDQSAMHGVPSVEINGQLYSTVAGRSFILVHGRRYHEGERLASGPAVESIGPDGATLRYQGQRYHVAGPG